MADVTMVTDFRNFTRFESKMFAGIVERVKHRIDGIWKQECAIPLLQNTALRSSAAPPHNLNVKP